MSAEIIDMHFLNIDIENIWKKKNRLKNKTVILIIIELGFGGYISKTVWLFAVKL